MSRWTDALTDTRVAEAKAVYEGLEAAGWHNLSTSDRRMLQALGYLCLERDDITLSDLVDADMTIDKDGDGD